MIALITAAFFAAPVQTPPIPASLAPYIHDGVFDPGDYEWLRGRFEGASPAEQATTETIDTWLAACREAGATEQRAELVSLGIDHPALSRTSLTNPVCAAVSLIEHVPPNLTWLDFQRAITVASPVADSFLFATREAEHFDSTGGTSLREQLLARPLGEQMLRGASSWGAGDASNAPTLPPLAKVLVVARINAAIAWRDHDNTRWLKAIVERDGWPRISAVGAEAADRAWLLVQHADADPAFQLRALRLMRPLVDKDEVSKRNYVFLYDRVMLKLTGKQRYATQMHCVAGSYQPLPLEDSAGADGYRQAFGLGTIAENRQRMVREYGPCPSESVGKIPPSD